MKTKIIVVFIISLSSSMAVAGDILRLNNSMVFEGKVTRIRKCEVVFKTRDAKYVIPATEIYSIEFGDHQDHVYLNYLEDRDPNNCMKGRFDAENFHGKRGGHFLLGALFGPLAMLGTAISNPTPTRGRDTFALSPNKDLFGDPEYITCYKKRAKGQLIAMEAAGWAAWLGFLLIVSATNPQ